jgi:hypothetical protein
VKERILRVLVTIHSPASLLSGWYSCSHYC